MTIFVIRFGLKGISKIPERPLPLPSFSPYHTAWPRLIKVPGALVQTYRDLKESNSGGVHPEKCCTFRRRPHAGRILKILTVMGSCQGDRKEMIRQESGLINAFFTTCTMIFPIMAQPFVDSLSFLPCNIQKKILPA